MGISRVLVGAASDAAYATLQLDPFLEGLGVEAARHLPVGHWQVQVHRVERWIRPKDVPNRPTLLDH